MEPGEEHGGGREAGDRGLVHDAASVTEVTLPELCGHSLCAPGLDCRHCSLLHLPDVPLLLLRCSLGAQAARPSGQTLHPATSGHCDTGPVGAITEPDTGSGGDRGWTEVTQQSKSQEDAPMISLRITSSSGSPMSDV